MNSNREPGARNRIRWMHLFPSLVGFAAVVWFCVRVIPRPSRAQYPCQRAAFPLGSAFVVWVAGLIASAASLHKARFHLGRARYAVAAGFVALASLVWLGTGLTQDRPALAAVEPNWPIGVARGIGSGRVAWVFDPAATSWPGPGSSTLPWQAVDQAQVDHMFSVAVQSLAGAQTDVEAWDRLIRHFNVQTGRGDVGYTCCDRVFIKTNFTLTFDGDRNKSPLSWFPNRPECIDNSPQLSIALLKQLVDVVGVPASSITIGDPNRLVPNYWRDMVRSTPGLETVNLLDRVGGPGYLTATYSKVPVHWSVPNVPQLDRIPQAVVDAAYLINFPVLTSHNQNGVTITAKNLYGALIRNPNDPGYFDLHSTRILEDPAEGRYRALVDLMGHEQFGGKTLLYLIDGLYGAQGWAHVPVRWAMSPFNNDWTSSVFASQDPVAIDSVAFDFLYAEYAGPDPPGDLGPRSPAADDYLHEAALADSPPSGTFYDPENDGSRLSSLGAHEHWNNPVQKLYLRNRGYLEGPRSSGIELAASLLDSGGKPADLDPVDAKTGVPLTPTLTWSAGADATASEVYFGTDPRAVASRDRSSPAYQGKFRGTSFSPGPLEPRTVYYWTVVGVQGAQKWPTPVLRFKTRAVKVAKIRR